MSCAIGAKMQRHPHVKVGVRSLLGTSQTPELKEPCQQGRKELFGPHGKAHVLTLGEQ